ncbi:hypothetical protein M9X92_000557 [Pyricularia oryzae]|nr:hypothetical protein M9X92_000557 [Pyricularia oryzae]
MHQANALGRCVGKVGSFGYTVLGVNARSTSGNNDWTIVSLGGINIETTNNALPVRRQRKYSVYCKRYFTQVLWQGGDGIGPGPVHPIHRGLSRASTHRCYTIRKGPGKKKGKAPSIQDKPMVTIEGDAAWAPQIGVALA